MNIFKKTLGAPLLGLQKIGTILGAVAALLLMQACTTDNVASGIQPNNRVAAQSQPQAAPLPTTTNNAQTATPAAPATVPTPNSNALAAQQVPPPNPAIDESNQQTASLAPTAGVSFLPVLGPPQAAVSKLSSAIKHSAQSNSVTLLSGAQRGAIYQVKGYFSALDDGSGTRFIYIWDVLNAQGKKVHRISGEERTGKRSSDPWQSVGSDMINKVVERTMQDLRGWMNSRA